MKLNKYLETDRAFYRQLLLIATPIALQSLVMHGVNLIDTIMLGALGETALSASSLANQFISLCTFCCLGISMGASVIVARCWGAKEIPTLKKACTIAFRVGALFATIVTVVNILFSKQIMQLYTPDSNLIEAGATYLIWSTLTYLLIAISLISTAILRNIGLSKIPFIASLVAFVVNIGANYMLIFGKFGAPQMGIAGAALGTVIARVAEMAISAGYLLVYDKRISYRIKDFLLPCKEVYPEFMRICLPVLISDGLLGVGDSMLAIIMGHIGTNFVSANAITMVTWRMCTVLISAISSGSSIMTGHTLGEGHIEKAQRCGYTFLALGALIGLVGSVAILLCRDVVINAYNITADTQDIVNQMLLAMSVIMAFRTSGSILTKGVLRAGGDTKFLMYADVLFMWILAIPLGGAAGLVWKLPAFWVFLFLNIDQVIKAVWCVFRLRSGKWIKRIKGINR